MGGDRPNLAGAASLVAVFSLLCVGVTPQHRAARRHLLLWRAPRGERVRHVQGRHAEHNAAALVRCCLLSRAARPPPLTEQCARQVHAHGGGCRQQLEAGGVGRASCHAKLAGAALAIPVASRCRGHRCTGRLDYGCRAATRPSDVQTQLSFLARANSTRRFCLPDAEQQRADEQTPTRAFLSALTLRAAQYLHARGAHRRERCGRSLVAAWRRRHCEDRRRAHRTPTSPACAAPRAAAARHRRAQCCAPAGGGAVRVAQRAAELGAGRCSSAWAGAARAAVGHMRQRMLRRRCCGAVRERSPPGNARARACRAGAARCRSDSAAAVGGAARSAVRHVQRVRRAAPRVPYAALPVPLLAAAAR
jgi:hypothetical protein